MDKIGVVQKKIFRIIEEGTLNRKNLRFKERIADRIRNCLRKICCCILNCPLLSKEYDGLPLTRYGIFFIFHHKYEFMIWIIEKWNLESEDRNSIIDLYFKIAMCIQIRTIYNSELLKIQVEGHGQKLHRRLGIFRLREITPKLYKILM